jgi:hypothetical protein
MIGFGPETVISLLGTSLIAIAGLLYVLPVGTCSECGHCKLAKLTRKHERELEASRSVDAPVCRTCGRTHRTGEDHPS